MSDHVVIDHHHDREAGVYRLTIGVPVTEERPALNKKGEPRVHRDGAPILEAVVVAHDQVRDYVFADEDDRWAKKSLKQIAAAQRKLVAESLKKQAAAAPRAVNDLPGIGGGL